MTETRTEYLVVPALELSANNARTRQEQLRRIRETIEISFLTLGSLLKEAHTANDWRTLGYLSFAHYAEDTLRVSKSEAFDLMRIAELGQKYPELTSRIVDAGKSNMRAVLPKITDPDDYPSVEGWIDTAAVNTWRELQGVIREEPMHTPHNVTCPNCGAQFQP